jgi:hypothetical protein
VLLVCGGLTLAACGKKDDGGSTGTAASASATATATAAATATATATASAAPDPSGSASAAPADTGSAAPADTGAPVATGKAPEKPIDDCCAALARAAHTSGRGKAAKNAAHRAEEICPGIAALVRQGRTTRASALTQIKSALVGRSVPPQCN